MPKVKSEKRNGSASAAPYSPPSKNGHSEDVGAAEEGAVGTVPTAGFRDGDKARLTLEQLKERDSAYQFQVVNSLLRRARNILGKTKDPEKVANLGEAIKIFEDWLNEYKAHNRSRENFNYLTLDIMEAYIPLAEHYGIKLDAPGENFLQTFKELKGDSRLLRTTKVNKEDDSEETEIVSWDIQRNRFLRELTARVKKEYMALFEFDMPLRGLPTREHCQMIVWGYSPEPTKIKKCIPQIAEKISASE